ncbi:MAG: malto-oligosyltrehalose synthase [Terriglobales bacterium]
MNFPLATYRLQLRPGCGFEQAAEQALDYLAALGVSHVFLSPILSAASGSQHGYDVADPEHVNPDLGGEDAFTRWCARVRALGLGQVLDIVPNHMTITSDRNRWWWSVLRHGESSPYAGYFDIAWCKPGSNTPQKLLLPWLGHTLNAALATGELHREGDTLKVGDMELPLIPNHDLDHQHYRLAHWSIADHELPYRRFFDVSHLIGVRVEDPEVFAATHRRIVNWLADGTLAGVRVDHVDGLREPAAYLTRLRAAAPTAWIVVEKILEPGEELPAAWPVAGTTGYDFLNRVMGLFLAPEGGPALGAVYQDFTGPQPAYEVAVLESKRQILANLLHSELRWLSRLAQAKLPHVPLAQLDHALGELAAQFSVYRTYAPAQGPVPTADAERLEQAGSCAAISAPAYAPLCAQLVALLLRDGELLLRFQQLTPAVYAKGVEDTAFYRSFRLCALNEVGGDPAHFGTPPGEFHAACAAAQRHWPAAMLTTSTHDTKRGEDVRARLCLLSEIPERWRTAVLAWQAQNRTRHSPAGPDANTEYLFYQTLVGAWPVSEDRMQAYLLKAVREAKAHTSWRKPNAAYESALRRFVAAAMRDSGWMTVVTAFVAPLVAPGRVNSLAQVLLKMTAPGVPDIYNGAELWDMGLVDPDNRRPVDFARRARLLAELDAGLAPELIWARQDEGLPKLWLIRQALRLRRQRPEAFGAQSSYVPLAAEGPQAGHVLAFLRGGAIVAVTPRLTLGLPDLQAELELPRGGWRNWLTGEMAAAGRCQAGQLLARFPVALLAREAEA